MIRFLTYTLFLFCCYSSNAQSHLPKDICEDVIPMGWSAVKGKLMLSSSHYKLGRESIKWDWSQGANSILRIQDTAFHTVSDDPRSGFVIWIYNENPINDKLKFTFSKGGQNVTSFDFGLNFKGWRTAWVMYHRDMQGTPVKDMDALQIQAPSTVNKGTLFIDQVRYNISMDPRSPMRDIQLPFVNIEGDRAANAHWNSLFTFSNFPHFLKLSSDISSADLNYLSQICDRFTKEIAPSKKDITQDEFEQLKTAFNWWSIRRVQGRILGKPVLSFNDTELITLRPTEEIKSSIQLLGIKRYTQLMFKVAQAYVNCTDLSRQGQLADIYIDMLDHMDDQGWSYGSGMGALHHHGYNLQGYYSACLLMKDVIKQRGMLERTVNSMRWFSGLGRVLQPSPDLPASNIDVFNTLLGSMLSAILIMDDGPEKVRYLISYSRWLSNNLVPDHTIEGAFKPDGAVFHHGNLYPAYGIGGFTGVAPIIYTLSKTPYSVSNDAHLSFRNSLYLMHVYTNPFKWPISISGRHPTGTWRIADAPFAYLALSGTAEGSSAVDTLMARVYLRLNTDKRDKWTELFRNMGIDPADSPRGHWNLNYGLFDIHRRQDWLLTVRGHNRYFVSHESYPGANMYGRYLSYGHLEVLFPDTEADNGSNFKDEGWDWNNIPGTTTLYLPMDKLRANIINADNASGIEEMLISDERFAGGIKLDGQGLFAMKLRGHDKYDMGSFRAIKSWFMFDSLIVCLGSDIQNTRVDYTTQTTLLQNYLRTPQDVVHINGLSNADFPFVYKGTEGTPLTVIDNRKIGYYIPDARNIILTKNNQLSRDQKDLGQTSGDFVKMYIQHGVSPKKERYEYTMLINTQPEDLSRFSETMRSNRPLYQVLQQDSIAHIVRYNSETAVVGLALMQGNARTNDNLILDNDKPSLLMYKVEADVLKLSVTDPDLAFYEGADDSPLTQDGKRKEVSIYSRSWYRSPSKPSTITLEIRGCWGAELQQPNLKEITILANGNTRIRVSCADGIASDLKLKRKHT